MYDEFAKKLSISPQLLIESGISGESCEAIVCLFEQRSQRKYGYSAPICTIKEAWQLQALSGETRFYPSLTQKIDAVCGAGLALYAAMSGKTEALDWVQTHHPRLLRQRDTFNRSIGHYAVWSRSIDMCLWVQRHEPTVLFTLDHEGHDMINEALRREDLPLLHAILALSHDPSCLHVQASLYHFIMHTDVISKLLENNYTLTAVVCNQSCVMFSDRDVCAKLQRNRELKHAAIEYHDSPQNRYQYWINKAIKVAPSMPESMQKNVFKTLFHLHAKSMITLIHDEILRLLPSSIFIHSEWTHVALNLGVVRASDDKIKVLYALKNLIMLCTLDVTHSFPELFNQWEDECHAVIDQQENMVTSVYASMWQPAPTPTRVLVDHLEEVLSAMRANSQYVTAHSMDRGMM